MTDMVDYRTEDQKVAAVAASMTMAGQPVTPEDEARGRRILRGELTGDQAVLEVLEEEGLADSARAAELRRRQRVEQVSGMTTPDHPKEP